MMNNPRSQRRFPPVHLMSRGSESARPPGSGIHVATVASFVADETLFLANLKLIDEVTGKVCRRHRLAAAEADDFRSDVRLHFIERNYEVLRQFEGRSSLATYITVVVQRLFLDRRNRLWGKWRPTAEARRLGPTAILFERLVTRDGWTTEQALETLRVNHGVVVDESLRSLCDKLEKRVPSRQLVPEDQAEDMADAAPTPEANVLRAEQGFLAKRVQTALDRARQTLSAEERLILKMRFEDGASVAVIARALHLDQKRLYRTLQRLLDSVRAALTHEGISRSDVDVLFADASPDSPREAAVNADAGPAVRPAERERRSWLQNR
jgi:RNA polymerase sigma factor (sigma-70 family)